MRLNVGVAVTPSHYSTDVGSRVRSAKYLLQPTARQRVKLDHLLWQQRLLYNEALEERKKAWEAEKRSVTRFDQFKSLNGIATTNPELGQYGVTVARGTLTRLDLAFQSFYRRCKRGDKPGHPRFKGHYRFNSVLWPDANGWKLDQSNKRFYAMGVGHIKAKLHRPLPGRPKTATLSRQGTRWWLSVGCDQVPGRNLSFTNKVVGIDLGTASMLTTSEGEHIANPRHGKQVAVGLARAQRDLARKTKSSNRRRKAVQRAGNHYRKIANQRHNHAHQVSRHLVDNFDFIAHEKLQIKNMVRSAKGSVEKPGTNVAQKRGLNRSIHEAGWGSLIAKIAYKAEEAGRQIEAVNPRNTSRTCAACGHCEKANRPNQAVFRCLRCDHRDHADVNAAINILRAGLAQRALREAREDAA